MSTSARPLVGFSGATSLKSQLRDYYLWEEPESGLRIYLNLATVDRLQLEVLRGIGGSPSDEAEVGGILIGRTELDGERTITLIEDFAPVPCGYCGGPHYRLLEKDAVQLEAVLARCSSDPRGLSVVGYYRSHNRDDLYLSSDDLSLIQKYFSRPENVFLLVKTLPSKACTAGFFFWEDGHIQSEFTYLEVPFGPVQSFPVAEPAPPATVRIDDRLPPAARDLLKKAPTVQSLRLSESVRHPHRLWLILGLAVTVAAVVVSLAGLNYWQSRQSHPQKTASTALALHVQRQPGSLALTWNPNSRDLIGAEETVLHINERSNQKAHHLDPSQISSGAVSLAPSSEDIAPRFEIDRGGKPGAAEKVHLPRPNIPVGISAREGTPNPTDPQGLADLKRTVVARENPSRSDTSSQATSIPALSPSSSEKEQGQQTAQSGSSESSPKAFRFVAPTRSLQSSNNTANATNDIQLEQPPSIPLEIKISATLVPFIPAALGKAGPSQRSSVTSFVGPHLIRPVNPAIPLELRSRITQDLQIEVAVTIDTNGKVTDAKLASTKGAAARFISAEVLQAARLFLFRPAQDSNRNVESKMVLAFHFSGGPTK
jgi:hypothetical protein